MILVLSFFFFLSFFAFFIIIISLNFFGKTNSFRDSRLFPFVYQCFLLFFAFYCVSCECLSENKIYFYVLLLYRNTTDAFQLPLSFYFLFSQKWFMFEWFIVIRFNVFKLNVKAQRNRTELTHTHSTLTLNLVCISIAFFVSLFIYYCCFSAISNDLIEQKQTKNCFIGSHLWFFFFLFEKRVNFFDFHFLSLISTYLDNFFFWEKKSKTRLSLSFQMPYKQIYFEFYF